MTSLKGPIRIIGQGIAGTSLAWQCYFQGIPFQIIDDGHRRSSSLAAAGLFNPLILKRRRLAWRAVEFFEQIPSFYLKVEEVLSKKIYHPKGIWRRISDVKEANDWMSLKDKLGFDQFLGKQVKELNGSDHIEAPFGFQEVVGAGYVDVAAYLEYSRAFFESQNSYQQSSYEYQKADEHSTTVLARGISEQDTAEIFGTVPFSPAKGHSLEITSVKIRCNQLISGPCFLIPLGNDRYRVGSTYSWSKFESGVEEGEIEKLSAMLESFVSADYEITQSWAGVRPATKDRRPLMGRSNTDENVLLFNGLGSRAIMTTPLLSKQLLDHIIQGTPLWPEVDVHRFSDK